MFFSFNIVKNHKIANNSTATEANEYTGIMEIKLFYRLEYFISCRVDKADPHREFAVPFKAANF
jgi:hypothetical protein